MQDACDAELLLCSDHADPNRLALAFRVPQPHLLRLFLRLEGLRQRRKLAPDILEWTDLHPQFIFGCILLDMAAQLNRVANQTRIFGIDATARSRINIIYMTLYFLGASLGSYVSTAIWSHYQWTGVTLLGFVFLGFAAVVHMLPVKTPNPLGVFMAL